ncbi:hypothetical protein HUG10_11655 [Halorarum halophilum]|uniref:Uncharacterized protein n=1 Tax=Halorarum halophilum TaxID=2743090 RepID=A0A7D5L2U2_9EURY|nr:hypothetical protein [Halobaculum halophilum]QLG28163.1 hypothetical protein HUG10_11655 [Halobaculum halophilum]
MPGLHKHKGKNSYYFVPRRHGDYHTYQIEDLGRDMILRHGYGDGDRVPWNIFYTLNDLGLLYFKESNADPRTTAPDPDEVDYDLAEELTIKERCEFVAHVLDNYALSDIESDAFFNLLLSITNAPTEYLDSAIESILSNTPFSATEVVEESEAVADYPPLLFASLLYYWYEMLRRGNNAQTYVKQYGGECIHQNDEYAYFLVNSEAEPPEDIDTSDLQLEMPRLLLDSLSDPVDGVDEGLPGDLFEEVTVKLETRKLNQETTVTGPVVAQGIAELEFVGTAIVPLSEMRTLSPLEKLRAELSLDGDSS